jgi:5'-deoxynucleotidase YfbR-like HD superfamily hydrolase
MSNTAEYIQNTPSAILTYTNKHIDPLDLKPEDIDIRDIAHALSNQCRFSGHVSEFYSVAQHSVIVSYAVPSEWALDALIHDAVETYLQDLVRPLKLDPYFGKAYRGAENRAQKVIAEVFHTEWPMPPCVKEADNRALVTEARDLMPSATKYWELTHIVTPFPEKIIPLSPKKVEKLFLKRYTELTNINV